MNETTLPPDPNSFKTYAPPPPVEPDPNAPKSPKARKSLKTPVIITLILLPVIVGIAAYFLLGASSQPKPVTVTTAKVVVTSGVNSWTGKGGDLNWSNAKNWSLGKPANGQSLKIDVANIGQVTDSTDGTATELNDDIANLKINKLIITGASNNQAPDIHGKELAIAGGIELSVTQPQKQAAGPSVDISNQIDLTGDQTIQILGNNFLVLNGVSGANLNLGSNTIQFKVTGTSTLDVSEPIVGTGKIIFPDNAIDPAAPVYFYESSPQFSGKVTIGKGDYVGISNSVLSNNNVTVGTVDAFGTASINIAAGGTLNVFAAGANSFTLNNDITMSGNGDLRTGVDQPDPKNFPGAINSCISQGQEGCGLGTTITLTGKVTLTGDTQLGASFGGEAQEKPTSTVATYVINNLIAGNYTLTAVPGSFVVVQQK